MKRLGHCLYRLYRSWLTVGETPENVAVPAAPVRRTWAESVSPFYRVPHMPQPDQPAAIRAYYAPLVCTCGSGRGA